MSCCMSLSGVTSPVGIRKSLLFLVILLNLDTVVSVNCYRRRSAEAARAAIIAEERSKLLAEAAELADYLPPGVLRDRRELELMRQRQAAAANSQLQQ